MSEQLSAFRIKQGRRIFDSFSGINSFSFALVTGNTITLYAMLLGANSTVIGLLGAFMFLSFFSIPLGRYGLKRWGLVKTFAHNWMLRNLSLIPLLFIPFLYARGVIDIAILMIVPVFVLKRRFCGVAEGDIALERRHSFFGILSRNFFIHDSPFLYPFGRNLRH